MRNFLALFVFMILILTKPCLAFADPLLVWGASSGDVQGYRIYYGTTQGQYESSKDIGDMTQCSLFDLPLQEGSTYYFIVKAYNAAGESDPSNEVQWVVPDTSPPGPPQGLVGNPVSEGDVNLTWQANAETDIKGYKVYYGTTSRIYGSPCSVENATTHTITGLNQGTTYYFAVSALDTSDNESGWSQEVAVQLTDTESPVVAVVTPSTSGTYDTETSILTIAGTATDNIGVTQVSWSNSRGGAGVADGTGTWNVSAIQLYEGENILTVTACDAAGNEADKTLGVFFSLPEDSVLPSIDVSYPTTRTWFITTNDRVALGGTASDNVALSQITWRSSSGFEGKAEGTSSWSVPDIQLSTGWNRILLTALDTAGNQKMTALWVYRR